MSDNCIVCGKKVFFIDRLAAESYIFHKNCFRCDFCRKPLTPKDFGVIGNKAYCKPHFDKMGGKAAASAAPSTPAAEAQVEKPVPTTTTSAPATGGLHAGGKTYVSGSGLEPARIKIGDVSLFTLFVRDDSDKPRRIPVSDIKITITPDAKPEVFDNNDGSFDVEWEALSKTTYTIEIVVEGKQIKGSPFVLNLGGGPAPAVQPATPAVVQPAAPKVVEQPVQPVQPAQPAPSASGALHGKSYASGIDASKVKIGDITMFTLYARDDANKPVKIPVSKISVKIDGPEDGKPEVFDNNDGSYDVEWEAIKNGTYVINITIEGKPIKDSPFTLNVGVAPPAQAARTTTTTQTTTSTVPAVQVAKTTETKTSVPASSGSVSLSQTYAAGQGLEGSKVVIGDSNVFTVYVRTDAGKAVRPPLNKVDIKIDPRASSEVIDLGNGSYDVDWEPTKSGTYTIDVRVDGHQAKGSPFSVTVVGSAAPAAAKPASNTGRSTASGSGLDKTKVKVKDIALFTVYPKNDQGQPQKYEPEDISVTIDGPGNPKPQIFENDDLTFDVEYEPLSAGKYVISVVIAGKPIIGSPFVVDIGGSTPAPAPATVSPATTTSTPAPAKTTPAAAKGVTPKQTAPVAAAKKGAQPAPAKGSGASKSIAAGGGLDSTKVKINDIAFFTVTPKDDNGQSLKLTEDQILVTIDGPGNPKADVFDNNDGTFDVEYEPKQNGKYVINVTVEGRPVIGAPFTVNIGGGGAAATPAPGAAKPTSAAPAVWANSTASGKGLDPTRFKVGDLGIFTVYPKDNDNKTMKVVSSDIVVKITGPENSTGEVFDNEDGSYDVEWEPTKPGKYSVSVDIKGIPVKGSPFTVDLGGGAAAPVGGGAPAKSSAASTCDVSGPGLLNPKVGEVNYFTIVPKEKITTSRISVTIDGPGNPKADIFDNEDNSFDVEFNPVKEGEYSITIKIDGDAVKNSPFKINLGGGGGGGAKLPGAQSEASGVGLKSGIKVGADPAVFTLYPKDDARKPLKVTTKQISVEITGAATVKPDVFDNEDNTWDIEWFPPKAGTYNISIKINGNVIKSSPFQVVVK